MWPGLAFDKGFMDSQTLKTHISTLQSYQVVPWVVRTLLLISQQKPSKYFSSLLTVTINIFSIFFSILHNLNNSYFNMTSFFVITDNIVLGRRESKWRMFFLSVSRKVAHIFSDINNKKTNMSKNFLLAIGNHNFIQIPMRMHCSDQNSKFPFAYHSSSNPIKKKKVILCEEIFSVHLI